MAARGVVAGSFGGEDGLNGFYLQRRSGGGRGVFVYTPEMSPAALPAHGRMVLVEAHSGRYQDRFQLEWVEGIARCGHAAVEAAALRAPPEKAQLRRLEDRLVRIDADLVVTGNRQLARFGTLRLAVGSRRYRSAAGGVAAGVLLDDGSHARQPRPVPYLGRDGTRRLGARVKGLVGVLDHAFGAWRLHPTEPPVFDADNPRKQPPGSAGRIRVVGFNLRNFFLADHRRGPSTAAAFARKQARVGAAIGALDADVLALQEVQNRDAAVAALLEAIHAATPDRRYRAATRDLHRGDGVLRNVILYRPDRLTALDAAAHRHRVHDRAPVATLFRGPMDQRLRVLSTHFKSRGGCPRRGDIDRGGGCWNERREDQARALRRWLKAAGQETATPTVVLGDFNAYAGERPLRVLTHGEQWRNSLTARVPARLAYTYVYRGVAGALDHALLNGPARERLRGVTIWHANADEPIGLAGKGPWRSSDHDPVIVDLFAHRR